jgi:hypothetical protein
VSNQLAVAATTFVLTRVLGDALAADVDGNVQNAAVTTLRPDSLGEDDASGINVFLYRIGPDAAWAATALPTRRTDGTLLTKPQQALTLHYLLTFSGDESELEPQRMLGLAVGALAARPVLSRPVVRAAIKHAVDADSSAWEQYSDLAEQVDVVRFTLKPLDLDEMSKLWAMFVQATYRLSIVYEASVVLIDADVHGQTALPVREVGLDVSPVVPGEEPVPAVRPAVGGGMTVVDGKLTIPVTPPVPWGQQASVLLNEYLVPAGQAYTISARPPLQEDPDPRTELVFPVTGVAAGDYVVRLRVNGLESELGIDADGRYATPRVTIP